MGAGGRHHPSYPTAFQDPKLNIGEHAFHEALTLSPTRSVPLGYHRLIRRGSGVQAVLCFGYCVEVQNRPRLSEETPS